MGVKIIKIFLASSSELKEEREAFREFISIENNTLVKEGIYLELITWEYFYDAVSATGLQEEYNKAIKECELMVCLFYTKAGKYTVEEFNAAYLHFKEHGRPHIFTYFKQSGFDNNVRRDHLESLWKFQDELKAINHFYTRYNNIDALKNNFKRQLTHYLKNFVEATPPTVVKDSGTTTTTPKNGTTTPPKDTTTSNLSDAERKGLKEVEEILIEKLNMLIRQESFTTDVSYKFQLKKEIQDVRKELEETRKRMEG